MVWFIMARRPSRETLDVLSALIAAGGSSYGADLRRQTGIASGTIFPMLLRLEDAGWLVSEWETEDAQSLARPRRRYYTLTALGRREFAKAEAMRTPERFRPLGGPAWA